MCAAARLASDKSLRLASTSHFQVWGAWKSTVPHTRSCPQPESIVNPSGTTASWFRSRPSQIGPDDCGKRWCQAKQLSVVAYRLFDLTSASKTRGI